VSDLGRYELPRSWLRSFGHVFGMIMVAPTGVPKRHGCDRW
jgi:hypothetical protein